MVLGYASLSQACGVWLVMVLGGLAQVGSQRCAPQCSRGPTRPTSSYVCELRRAILARGYHGGLRVCPCAGVLRHGLVCDWRVRCGAIRVCASGVVLGTPGARASWGKEGCVRGGATGGGRRGE